VLVRELQSLGVNVELMRKKDGAISQAMEGVEEGESGKEAKLTEAVKEKE